MKAKDLCPMCAQRLEFVNLRACAACGREMCAVCRRVWRGRGVCKPCWRRLTADRKAKLPPAGAGSGASTVHYAKTNGGSR